MGKSQVTAASFLKNIGAITEAETAPTTTEKAVEPKKTSPNSRAGLKHIGGYLDRETVELIAILRARLNLDNSQLIKRAIEEMYGRETAARKFGDR